MDAVLLGEYSVIKKPSDTEENGRPRQIWRSCMSLCVVRTEYLDFEESGSEDKMYFVTNYSS